MREKRLEARPGTYKVGKGQPPLATRWKAGQSGNPRGRPKGAKNLVTIFSEALSQKLEIQENGKVRKISAREGIVRRLVNQALKGDIKATAFVLAKEPEIARSIERRELVRKPLDQIPKKATAEEAMQVYMRIIKGITEHN
jgi:hypothetical protein